MLAKIKALQKNVTTAGTAVQLTTSSINAYGCKIKAKSGNTGFIYVGDANTVSSSTGYELDSDQTIDLSNLLGLDPSISIDLSNIWLNSSVNAEGVAVTWLERLTP